MTGHHGWGYGQNDGPSQWHKLYPIARGDRQSPINIVSSKALFSPRLKPLKLSYEGCTSLSIANNGHSVQVDFNDSDDRSVMTGGPLDGPYRLKQFHFHWGKKHNVGSEHTVDGKSFPSELHLVHWNARKYSTFGEAASAPDGLAVVGVFLETGDEHPSMNRLTDALYMVRFKAMPLRAAEGTGEDMMAKELPELQLLHTSKWVNRARPRLGDGIWDHRHLPTICINEPRRSLDPADRNG
ncbi:PREDICTED: carbonic anhydrase 7 isoform X2 [Hipposideros armiger]|uniref:Carbonic anhydrase n=1 Tax=Hipposideros armiger TaxID=186990 RepID=A0A8B7S810_HIPAR|nr:PREDICTED: carbonic anhydrase 7 isoform X2 [Hipposideros armiger]